MKDKERQLDRKRRKSLWDAVESHRLGALATLFGTIATIIATVIALLTYWERAPSYEELHPNLNKQKTLSVVAEQAINSVQDCQEANHDCSMLEQQAQQSAAAERLAKELFAKIMDSFNCPIWQLRGSRTGPRIPGTQESAADLRFVALMSVEQYIFQLIQLVENSNLNIKAAAFGLRDEFQETFRPYRSPFGTGQAASSSVLYQGIAASKEERWIQAQQFSRSAHELCKYIVDECPSACVLN